MKRRPGEQAPDGEEQISDEQLRSERVAEARRQNENRNQEMLDRRNAIADQSDDIVHADMDDIDGDKVVKRVKRTPEEIEAAAFEDDEETERARQEQENAESLNADEIEANNQRIREEEGEAEEGDSKKINGVMHYLLVVNGKEKWLTLKQLRETSSKVDAADEYLQQAAESARRAVSLRTSEAEETDEVDTEVEEMLNKALLGDPESVKKLARHLKASPSRVTPDVMQAVDERLTFRDAVNWFESEYKTELADANLKAMIVREDVLLRDQNPTMGYRERLKKAGDKVRKWRNSLTGGTSQQSDGNSRPNKQLRKQQMTPVAGAGGRQATREDDDAEEPVTDQIQRMAQSRHQARAIKH